MLKVGHANVSTVPNEWSNHHLYQDAYNTHGHHRYGLYIQGRTTSRRTAYGKRHRAHKRTTILAQRVEVTLEDANAPPKSYQNEECAGQGVSKETTHFPGLEDVVLSLQPKERKKKENIMHHIKQRLAGSRVSESL